MPSFKAESVVEALDWDFNPYVAAKGVIPEPTDIQVAEFLSALRAVIKEAQADVPDEVPSEPAAIMEAIDNMDPEKTVEQMSKMCAVYAGLCSGTPGKEEIQALPMRVRTIFFTWLQEQVMAPEAASPGMNGTVSTLPIGRAG